MPVENNPFDDERLSAIRTLQSDPIIQYYIVRTDVPMSIGKIGAQIAHDAQMFIQEYERREWAQAGYGSADLVEPPKIEDFTPEVQLTIKWLESSFTKVVLGGKKKDFERIKAELMVFMVRDAGLTEVEPNTETVLVTWPILKSTQPKFLSRLQTLK